MRLVIKERKRELLLNLFSCFVSAFLPAEARHLDNVDVCCFLCAAALQDVFELSSLDLLSFCFESRAHISGQCDRFVNALMVYKSCESCFYIRDTVSSEKSY